jgi:hypothetical protein
LKVKLPDGLEFFGLDVASGSGGLKIEAERTTQPWLDLNAPKIDRVDFFLVNFAQTLGAMIRTSSTSRYAGRQGFEFDGWRMKVDLLPDSPHKVLRESGGYGFTHSVSVSRHDGKPFAASEAEQLLKRLYWGFTFINGARTTPALHTGYVGARPVWRDWCFFISDPWNSHRSSLPKHGEVGPFVRALSSLLQRKGTRTIEACIHWYVEANNCGGGVEGSLVMILTALERLAWLELVQLRRCLSRDGFEKLPAHDKVAALLSILGIPLDVPPELPTLAAQAAQRKPALNGVRQLCELRNRIVHPPKQDEEEDVPFELLEQAWRYGLHFLELAILRLAGFEGKYANRVLHAECLVPWAVPALATSKPKPRRPRPNGVV